MTGMKTAPRINTSVPNAKRSLTADDDAAIVALCEKILKAIGPQRQVILMNALYLAMQIADSAEFRDCKQEHGK